MTTWQRHQHGGAAVAEGKARLMLLSLLLQPIAEHLGTGEALWALSQQVLRLALLRLLQRQAAAAAAQRATEERLG